MNASGLPPITTTTTTTTVVATASGNYNSSKIFLPTRTQREDKRKTSSTSAGSKASLNRLSSPVNIRGYPNPQASTAALDHSSTAGMVNAVRAKKPFALPRNHSDSALKNLWVQASIHSQEVSGGTSVSSPSSATAVGGSGDRRGAEAPRQKKYLANGHRALSWCETDRNGSQAKLQTLFERQHSGDSSSTKPTGNWNKSSSSYNNANITLLANNKNASVNTVNNIGSRNNSSPSPTQIKKTSNNARTIFIRGKDIVDTPDIVSPKEMFYTDLKNKKLPNEKTRVPGITPAVAERNKMERMRRSNSENKLTGRQSNQFGGGGAGGKASQGKHHQFQRALPRTLSVDRLDKLTPPNPKLQRKSPLLTSRNPQGVNFKIRRVSSVANLPDNRNNGNLDEVFAHDDDEDSIESNARLVAWLNTVNSIEEFEMDPKDHLIEYSDEPAQTDTAIHLVYSGD